MIDLRNHSTGSPAPRLARTSPCPCCTTTLVRKPGRCADHLVRPRARRRRDHGRAGFGKTVSARAATAALDQTRHTRIDLADPTTGTRGVHHTVVTALSGPPAHGTATLAAQAAGLLAAEHGERGRVPLPVIDGGDIAWPTTSSRPSES